MPWGHFFVYFGGTARRLPTWVVPPCFPDHIRAVATPISCGKPDFNWPGKHLDEENSVPADALSGAMVAGGRLRDRRLRALFALSRGRVLDRRAGVRWRSAHDALQDPD